MSNLVLAIDGPSGSGKSSTAKAIAIRANWSYLDTGALYRAVTLLALDKKIDSEDLLMQELSGNEISFETSPVSPKVLINGKDVSAEIRMQRINDSVSKVSAMPQVRNFLLEIHDHFEAFKDKFKNTQKADFKYALLRVSIYILFDKIINLN